MFVVSYIDPKSLVDVLLRLTLMVDAHILHLIHMVDVRLLIFMEDDHILILILTVNDHILHHVHIAANRSKNPSFWYENDRDKYTFVLYQQIRREW
jgi:hypothetical protein